MLPIHPLKCFLVLVTQLLYHRRRPGILSHKEQALRMQVPPLTPDRIEITC